MTVISIVVVVLPPVLVAVIVYVVEVESMVGVPMISPVDESILKPVGRVGLTDHVTTGPPLVVGTPVVEGPKSLVKLYDVEL